MGHNTFEITTANFQEQVRQSTLPVLVDFTADWCPPCKMLAPIVDELALKYADKLRIGTVDCDLYPELSEQFGVMGMPTLILFQNGEPVKQIVGYQPREKLERQLVAQLQIENA